ncbi:helix-turn-helix domain-containing protein [Nocardioides marmotae]|uniref:helix-turn-helix domain-containing protein n=1 Tax=Nocardioides marmotae TaxID=2663857 RepID=UPI0013231427|nr:AraC family transcriptional regulator [Nocardioides marmotae]MBC9735454.1 helix-turn-helix transcriptional regulator [Nocardioides marmotae]MTB86551.1 helix-turn-helix domain-containing protein [Nocardioides marmotae]
MRIPPELEPYVASLASYDVDLGAPGSHRGLPSSQLTLVLPADDPLDVAWAGEPGSRTVAWSSVSGLHTGPARIRHDGHQRGVQLALTPLGARALLGMPAAELAGRLLTLPDLAPALAPGLRHLPERLAETPHERRAALVAAALADQARRRAPVALRPEVARALALLARGRTVAATAAEVGYSRRHLAQLVRAETGLTPKQLHRIGRFERSRDLLGRRRLAEVAAACGYADQAHLTREWTALAGCPPSAWISEELPFVQDTAAAGAAR